jgi:translation initiation factor 5B
MLSPNKLLVAHCYGRSRSRVGTLPRAAARPRSERNNPAFGLRKTIFSKCEERGRLVCILRREILISALWVLLGMALRSPICTVVGHVDHGKTTLLDRIRSSAVAAQEAGAITQAIGASIIPIDTIRTLLGNQFPDGKVAVPGILFIDTPGHAAFTSLRKRGGSLADIAILLVNLQEGFKPQTREALEILKTYKTPFVIAANKLDLTPGFRTHKDALIPNLSAQAESVQTHVDTKLYELVGTLSEFGIQAERFDRIENFQKQAAIVPISALTGHGLPELLLVILGLARRFLEGDLEFTADGPGKGVVLEVKEEQGLGTTLDVILYDGTLSVGDPIAIGTLGAPIQTKVRALFEPNTNTDLRDRKAQFRGVQSVTAAIGVKVAAPGIDGAIAGMPLIATSDAASIAGEFSLPAEMQGGEHEGVLIKADTLGSAEAIIQLFREHKIPVHRASIGPINKKDVAEALSQKDPVIIGFNVPKPTGIDTSGVAVLVENVIYHLIDRYEAHRTAVEQAAKIPVRPAKLEYLPNHTFRQSNPLICGMNVIAGELATGTHLMKNGTRVALVKEIQENKKNVTSVGAGKSVAVSLIGPTAGRQISEGDILYTSMNEEEFRALRAASKFLTEPEKDVLREIATIMRAEQPLWGV